MENSNDTIGNRTLDLPTYSAVPQPIATSRAPCQTEYIILLTAFKFVAELINKQVATLVFMEGFNTNRLGVGLPT